MKLLNRDQITQANDVKTEDVAVPEWAPDQVLGEDGALRPITDAERAEFGVRIRNLTGKGRGAFIQESMEMKKKEDNKEQVDFKIEMLLIAMTAVDDTNNLIFSRDDVEMLGDKNAAAISRCAQAASRLSGLDKAAEKAAGKP